MIDFREHESYGYAARTVRNISQADITLAFAYDFNSAGEKLTRNLCDTLQKPYQAINLYSGFDAYDRIEPIVWFLKSIKCESINIAGNGIYTLRQKYTQTEIDEFIINFMTDVIKGYGKRVKILSGGQTGVDEAGLKFGDITGLETICNFPKGWLFRDIRGKDISNKEQFLSRFHPVYNTLF